MHDNKSKNLLKAGEKAIRAGKVDEAIMLFERAVAHDPNDGYALYHLATAFGQARMNGAALNLFMRSIQLSPSDASWLMGTWCNMGVSFRQEGFETEARNCFEEALRLSPEDVIALANYAGTYVNMGDPATGIALAKRALAVDPYNAQAGHHLGLLLLEDGQYEEGWKWYQSRIRIPEFHKRDYKCPMWFGEKVKTLVIHGEQGLGDEILFCSLLSRAKERADKVVIECAERLIPAFERSFGIKCYPDAESLMKEERPDAYCPMGTLPLIFNVKEPLKHDGYIQPDQERVEHWKKTYPGYRIGISWRGGTTRTHEQFRNFDIDKWKKLIVPQVYGQQRHWLSVQYNEIEGERVALGVEPCCVESEDDRLALIASCDLIITVCNTTVHMAGSMNVPTWCLVPSKPAWRYGIHGDAMLWYPSVKLIRQGQHEDWTQVIERTASNLGRLQGAERESAPRPILRNDRPVLREPCLAPG